MHTVVFDMDGVIFDSESVMKRFWQEEADRRQFGDISEVYQRCVGVTEEYCRDMIDREYPALAPFSEFKKRPFADYGAYVHEHGLPLKPYVKELLTSLKAHHWQVGLASSTYLDIVKRELTQAGLIEYFDVIVGGDQLARSKPSPDIYLMACEKLRVDPREAYAVEDSHNGIRAAAAAGMHPIMVPDMLPATEEMRALSEAVFPSLGEVITYFFKEEV